MDMFLHPGASSKQLDAWDRVRAALHRDWEQTLHDFGSPWGEDLHQDAQSTLAQATGLAPTPERHVVNASDEWSDEVAVKFGYTAALSPFYSDRGEWCSSLEMILRREWESRPTKRPWPEVRLAVRYGWTRAKNA